MKLKEFEGKKLFASCGIPISAGILITAIQEIPSFHETKLLKVQTVANGRGKAGGILPVHNTQDAQTKASEFLGSDFLGETITEIVLDEKIDIAQELYLGLLFNTTKRVPVFIFSEEGGVDIEDLQQNSPEKITIREIDMINGFTEEDGEALLLTSSFDQSIKSQLKSVMIKLWRCFTQYDCKMLEVNPLVITEDQNIIAVDSVVVLDDDANYRRQMTFPKRVDARKKTQREITANKIDENDPRGVAGKTFLDLEGDIGVLTSGGGASMTLMDTLLECGGKAANFTEYSGDPSREKVQQLTRIVLAKRNLSGLLVAGAIANFTNIKETLTGVADVLIEMKPDFPIVIRRAGPHDAEAKMMLAEVTEKHGLDIHYFDEKIPLTKAAKIMVKLSTAYKQKKGVSL